MQADLALTEVFTCQVEVDIMKDRCKVYDEAPLRPNRLSSICNIQINNKNGSIEWKIPLRNILSVLLSGNCLAVVDSSFFLESLEYISIH